MADDQDFYETLGVPRNASQDDIQRAYRRLARRYHPDVNKDPGAEDRFKDISEAYDVLSIPRPGAATTPSGPTSARFPRTWTRRPPAQPAGAGAGPEPAAGNRGARWPGFSSRPGTSTSRICSAGSSVAGLAGAARGWGPIPGADQEAELELTLEEAYHGTRRSLSLSGDGARATLDVNVPAGVTDGQRIRLAGQGGRGGDGGANGDLYLVVRIAPHPRYRLAGRDLYVDLPLAPWEAALGTSVAVDTPGGEAKVKVPAGTSSGRRLRLRGRGLPNPRGKPATCSPRPRSWCRPGPQRPSGGCSSSSRPNPTSTRGGSRERSEDGAVSYALVRVRAAPLSLDEFAAPTGLHPELIRRLVALGLIDAARDPAGELLVPPGPGRRGGPGAAAPRRAWRSTTGPSRSSPTCSTGSPSSKRPCRAPDG